METLTILNKVTNWVKMAEAAKKAGSRIWYDAHVYIGTTDYISVDFNVYPADYPAIEKLTARWENATEPKYPTDAEVMAIDRVLKAEVESLRAELEEKAKELSASLDAIKMLLK